MSALDDNITKLTGYLERFRTTGIANRIAGQDVAGAGGVFQTISPVDKSVICDVAHGTSADIDAAATAAHAAFAEWRDMPATQRRKILIRIAEGIEARAEEIALCECWDTGQTL
ncbi:MAG: aldehyde dehydrogenase family protein, partial [Paracoccaceae bacterium]